MWAGFEVYSDRMASLSNGWEVVRWESIPKGSREGVPYMGEEGLAVSVQWIKAANGCYGWTAGAIYPASSSADN